MKSFVLLCIATVMLSVSGHAQSCNCGATVPTHYVDLTSSPDITWSYSGTRTGLCCDQTGSTDCIRFIVTVHPQSSEVGFTSNVTGASFYQVDCGPNTPIGTPMCLSGVTTFCITFCKPGNNANTYTISASRGYSASSDVYIRENCTAPISVTGLNISTITWNSIPAGYNGYLSCFEACDAPNVTPTSSTPSYIDYRVCGTKSGCATGTYCDTVRVNVTPGMTVAIDPPSPVVCSTGPGTVTLTANPTGGGTPYSYSWSSGQTTQTANVGIGTYTVSVTDNSSCPAVTQTVTVNPVTTPDAPTAAGSTICQGQATALTATAPGGPYEWYNAASGGTLLYTGDTYTTPALLATTSYWVQSNPGCPGPRTEVVVTVNPAPSAPTASGTTICSGQTATLNATAPGGTYEWYDAASGGTILYTGASYTTPALSANTTFYVQTTVAGCAGPRTAVTVTVTPLPAAPTASGTTICSGQTATLTATAPGGTYQWYDAASGGTLLYTGASYTTPALSANTTYYVQTTVASCAGPRTAVTVTVTPLPAAPTASGTTICSGQTATLNATAPGGTYEWYDASSGGSLLHTGASYTTPALSANTTYYVQTTVSGCAGPRTAVTVTVTPLPAAPTASGTTICFGQTATLTATAPGGTYQWYDAASGGTLLYTGASYTTPALSANTTYYVQTTVASCAGPRTAVTVTVTPLPAAPTASGTTICSGQTATLTATAPGGTYQWYDAASGGTLLYTDASYTTPALSANITYYVQTTVSGCAGPRTAVTVTVNPIPVAPTATGTTICEGQIATLTATAPGGTYDWYDASSGGNHLHTGASYTTPALTANATYYVQSTAGGCAGPRTAVTVTVNPTPAAPTAAGTGICTGTTATLTATAPGGTYTWYNAASGGTLLFTGNPYTTGSLVATTSFFVQTTVSGCAGPRTEVVVTVNPQPAAPTASSATICQGNTATLTATAPGGTYEWYNASSGGTLLFTGASYTTPALISNTTYYVQSNVSGCIGPRTAVTVTVNPTPAAPTASGTTICNGSTATLNATAPGGTYEWYDASFGGILLYTGASYTTPALSASTTYYVQTTISGCTGPRTAVTVTVNPIPAAPTATGTTICEGNTATLTATAPGGTYGWYDAASGGSLLFTGASYTTPVLSATTTYYVQTTVSGCVSTRTAVTVTVNPTPAAPTASGATICAGETATLTATAPGGTYGWYDAASGGNLLFTGASYTTPALLFNTTYYVQTTVSGCEGPRTSVTVTVNPIPAAPTAAGTSICVNTTATLTAIAPGGTYEWYSASSGGTLLHTGTSYTTPILAVSTTYYVQTTVAGCTGPRTAVTVTVSPVPAAPTAAGSGICTGTTATLIATAPGGTYQWYNAASGGTLLFTGASYTTPALAITTSYFVQTSIGGCSGPRTEVVVTVNPEPAAPTAPGVTICQNNTATLNASGSGGVYEWYNAASGGTLLFTGADFTTPVLAATTSYWVQSNVSGCIGPRTQVTVTVTPTPATPTAAAGTSICTGSTATLTATAPGGTYEWFDAASGGTLLHTGASFTTPALATTTTYYVQTTVSGCVSARRSVTVTVNPYPADPSASGTSICEGSTATITATAPGGTYQWYNAASGGALLFTGASYVTAPLSSTTSFYVQTTVLGCTSGRTEVVVTVNPIPEAPTAAGTTICQGENTTLTATAPGGTYAWYDAASGGNLLITNASYITPNLIATTSYYVQTTVTGCTSSRTAVTVNVTPTPANPTVSGTTICEGLTATLNATAPGGTYDWFDAASGGNLIFTGASYTSPVLTATTFYYVQSTISGCAGGRTAVIVTVTPTDDPTFSYPSGTYCITGPNPLPVISGGFPGSFSSTPAGIVFVSTTTGEVNLTASALNTYSITYTTTGPCPDSYSVNLTLTTAPDATFSYDNPYCQTGTNPLPTFSSGASAGLFTSSPAGLTFINNSTGEVDLVNTTPGIYTITNTISAGGGCAEEIKTNTIVINTAATVNAGSDQTICENGFATLNGSIGGSATSGSWSSTSGIFAAPSILITNYTPQPGISPVWLVLTTNDPAGPCPSVSDSLMLTVTPLPVAPSATGTTICAGETATLIATAPGGTYAWYDAASGGNLVFTGQSFTTPALTTTTTYYVQTTVNSCAGPRTAVTVDVTPLPAAPTVADATICDGETAALSATAPGGSYEWYDAASGGNLLASNANYTTPPLNSTTSYFVQTTLLGCTGPREEVVVTVNPIPPAPTATNINVCYGSSGIANATAPGGTYQWFDDATGGSLLYTGASYTTPVLFSNASYFVQTTILGCTGARTEVMATVIPLPDAPTASGVTICQLETATLTATAPGGTYDWFDVATGGISLFTGASFVTPPISSNTTYYVQTTVAGCPGSRTPVLITVTPLPDSPTASGETICAGETATLSATAPGGSYQWYDANTGGALLATGNSFTSPALSATTSYFVQTTLSGCTSLRTEVIITVNPIPTLPTVANISVCDGSSGTLTATAPGGTYQWYDAATGGTLLGTGTAFTTPPLTSNTHYYVQTTINGCTSNRTDVTVTVNPIPGAPTAAGVTVCQGEQAILTATAPGGTYRWYNAPSGGTLLATGATYTTPPMASTTTYYVQTTILSCISSRTPVTVTVTPLPDAPTAAGTTICEGYTATITTTAPGGNYEWYDAVTGGNLLAAGASYTSNVLTADTSFFVQTTINGCTGPRTEVIVIVTPTDNPNFSYSSGTYCVSGANPLPTIIGGYPGVFSAVPSGLVFISTTTGEIDVAASALNTYTVTFTTSGPCPDSQNFLLTVTDAPDASFSYDSPYCLTDNNPLPVFPVGSSAGLFSAMPSGLTFVNAATGEINFANTTPGTYTITNFIAASGGCIEAEETFDIEVLTPAIVNAGTDIVACEGFNVQLNGVIGGSASDATWSGGLGSFNNNGLINAVYTPAAGETFVTLTLTTDDPAGPCPSVSDIVTITINPTPSAPTAAGQTICEGGNAQLYATAPGGIYEWYDAATAGTLVATGDTLNTPALFANTSYFVQTTLLGCVSPRTEVVVVVNPLPVADAGTDMTACANNASVSLSGSITGSASQGVWTSDGSGSFIPNEFDLNATYVPSPADTTAGTVLLTLTTTNQPAECSSVFDTVRVTFTAPPWVFAGNDKFVCIGNNANISGQVISASGTGEWTTSGDGVITSSLNLSTVYQPGPGDITAGHVDLTLTSTNNGTCNPVSDVVRIFLVVPPTVVAGSDQTACTNTPAVLNGSVSGTSTTGIWASTGSGTFIPNDVTLNATYQPSAADAIAGSVILTLTSTNSCEVSDNLTLTVLAAPVVNAGADFAVCADATEYTLNGGVSGITTTGIWTTTGTGSFDPGNTTLNAIYHITQADSLAGSVQFTLTSTGNGVCNAVTDVMVLNITTVPDVDAGNDIVWCANNAVQLDGQINGGMGTAYWSTSGSGTFSPDSTDIGAIYTFSDADTSAGSVVLTLISTGACVVVSDQVIITIDPAPVAFAGADFAVCENNPAASLTGQIGGSGSSGTWSTTGDGTFSPSANDLNAVYSPGVMDIAAGTVNLILTTDSVSNCFPGSDTLTLAITPAPQVNAGTNIYICNNANANLHGTVTGASGTGQWQTAGDGTFSPDDMTLIATYIPGSGDLATGSVVLTLTSTDNGGCFADSDDLTVFITDYPTVVAGSDITICSNDSALLSGSVSGSTITGYWTSSGTGTFSPDSSYLNANYIPDAADIANGSVTLTLTSSFACAVSDQLTISIIPAPSADAGNNQVICQGVMTVNLNGTVSNTSSYFWSSNGTGTFIPDNTSLTAVYQLSQQDSLNGNIVITLAATGDPLCSVAMDSMTVTTAGNIQLLAGNDTSVCATAEIYLNGWGNAGTLYWSTLGTGTFIPDSSDLAAQYLFSADDTTAGSVVLILNSQTSCGLYTDSLTLTFSPIPFVEAGPDMLVCANMPYITINGIVTDGASTGIWTTYGTGYFVPNDSALNSEYYFSSDDTLLTGITFWLTSTNNGGCIEVSDSLFVTFEPSPVVSAGNDMTVCAGNNASLSGQITGAGGTGLWSTSGDGTFSPSADILNASYIPGTNDLLNMTVTLVLTSDASLSCASVTDSLVITFVEPGTSAQLADNDALCFGDSLFIVPVIMGDTGSFVWTSSGSGEFLPDTSDALPVYVPSQDDLNAGTIVIYMHYSYACGSKDDSLILTINPVPEAWFTWRTNCDNMNIIFVDSSSVASGDIVSWEWDFGDGGTATTSTAQHNYLNAAVNDVTLVVNTNAGCSDTIMRPVTVFEPVVAEFTASDTTPAIGDLVTFTNMSQNAITNYWTFGDNTGTSSEVNPQYTYNAPGTYPVWLFIEGANNCTDSATVNINIGFSGYAIPSAFSPNGDGLNDLFFIRGGPFTEYELRVFNNWGQQVFLSTEQQVGWDGTFKGKDLQEGVYVLIFVGKMADGTEINISGDITLVR